MNEINELTCTLAATNVMADGLLAEVKSLRRLKAKLEDYCDTVDGPDGEPQPNFAMRILGEWENGL